ncbi:MAG TPA: hypothetical protein VMF30_15620, partial [Pirellulales bacterium]|nr:hypothetical protein [Pirellulales bacterium]
VFFLLFTGTRYSSTVALTTSMRERLAMLSLVLLILIAGLVPSPSVVSRYHAAEEILRQRTIFQHDGSESSAAVASSPSRED